MADLYVLFLNAVVQRLSAPCSAAVKSSTWQTCKTSVLFPLFVHGDSCNGRRSGNCSKLISKGASFEVNWEQMWGRCQSSFPQRLRFRKQNQDYVPLKIDLNTLNWPHSHSWWNHTGPPSVKTLLHLSSASCLVTKRLKTTYDQWKVLPAEQQGRRPERGHLCLLNRCHGSPCRMASRTKRVLKNIAILEAPIVTEDTVRGQEDRDFAFLGRNCAPLWQAATVVPLSPRRGAQGWPLEDASLLFSPREAGAPHSQQTFHVWVTDSGNCRYQMMLQWGKVCCRSRLKLIG